MQLIHLTLSWRTCLSNLVATRQISEGDRLVIELDEEEGELCFRKARAVHAQAEPAAKRHKALSNFQLF
jgi:hypothetical protein